jgi:uncharacterized protein with beta-barrel porin domain
MPAIRNVAAAVLAMAMLSSQASAQDQPTAEQAMARVIHGALAPSSLGDWRYRWDAVSIRISRDMHWHLVSPDDADEEMDNERRRPDQRHRLWRGRDS